MIKNPLFSVLIANYNNGKYLMDAIDSVKAQSYRNWEIILVDDCSTDNSYELYKELGKDKNIHIYYNTENKGCGFTKNRCAAEAHGEICGFLDPDDTLLPKALEKHIRAHIDNPKASVVYSKAYFCDTDFNRLGEASLPDLTNGRTYFDNRWHGCMCLASYKKSYYDKTEGINPDAAAGVDQDLYFLIEEMGDIVALDEFCYNYVIQGHENAITNDNNYAKLWYWNLHARYRTAKRRGLDADTIMIEDMKKILNMYNIKSIYDQEVMIRSSYAYRIGKKIVKPFAWLKRLLTCKK